MAFTYGRVGNVTLDGLATRIYDCGKLVKHFRAVYQIDSAKGGGALEVRSEIPPNTRQHAIVR